MAAATGTAISIPTNPNREPNAKRANINQTGCRPTDDPTSLGANWVRTIYEDRAGVLWVGTWGGGVQRFDPEAERLIVMYGPNIYNTSTIVNAETSPPTTAWPP